METWRKARIFKDAELKGTVKSKERRGKKNHNDPQACDPETTDRNKEIQKRSKTLQV